jgi:hypothetical protein
MGYRTAQYDGMKRALGREVVDVGAAAAQEAEVFAPLDGAADV